MEGGEGRSSGTAGLVSLGIEAEQGISSFGES